jgi:hypothetical protein
MSKPHIAFVSPEHPFVQPFYLRGLKEAGAVITGISAVPASRLPADVRPLLDAVERVPGFTEPEPIAEAVRAAAKRARVERILTTDERHVEVTARARALLGLPGVSPETARLCRDKAAMKEALRAAGIPVAASSVADSAEAVRAFAEQTGYPLIIKPRGGMGSLSTYKLRDRGELDAALRQIGPGTMLVEEFVEGHEGFLDTLTYGGEIVHEFMSHYYPDVLVAFGDRTISPQIVTTNRVDAEGYEEVRTLARQVQRVLGIDETPTHMEWFFGPRGLKISEIAVRPAGDRIWDLYCGANETSVYREWGHLELFGRPSTRMSRKYSAGLVQVRPDRDGKVLGYQGLAAVEKACGPLIFKRQVPSRGTTTKPLQAGYIYNTWFMLRHPDYDRLREHLDFIGRTLRIRAG